MRDYRKWCPIISPSLYPRSPQTQASRGRTKSRALTYAHQFSCYAAWWLHASEDVLPLCGEALIIACTLNISYSMYTGRLSLIYRTAKTSLNWKGAGSKRQLSNGTTFSHAEGLTFIALRIIVCELGWNGLVMSWASRPVLPLNRVEYCREIFAAVRRRVHSVG